MSSLKLRKLAMDDRNYYWRLCIEKCNELISVVSWQKTNFTPFANIG